MYDIDSGNKYEHECPLSGQALYYQKESHRRWIMDMPQQVGTEDGEYRYWLSRWSWNKLELDESPRIFKWVNDYGWIEIVELFDEDIDVRDPFIEDRKRRYELWGQVNADLRCAKRLRAMENGTFWPEIFQKTVSFDQVSVQPLDAPKSMLFYLDFKYQLQCESNRKTRST